ncbi:unnamed protein product [Polarella glacialis]|uniref:Uncharacterized protein n=1 Tax=Polarella glacialis TaxID=89957 RepID=A0A813DM61_POLGL|nr:unnamed protein product [Polarella glacialis]
MASTEFHHQVLNGVVQPWNTDIGMNNRLVRQQGARQVVSFPMLNPPAEDGGSVKNDDLWAYGALALVGVAVLVGVIALVFVVNSRSKRSRAMLPEGSDSDQDHGQLLRQPHPAQFQPQFQTQPPMMGGQMGGYAPTTQQLHFAGPRPPVTAFNMNR